MLKMYRSLGLILIDWEHQWAMHESSKIHSQINESI